MTPDQAAEHFLVNLRAMTQHAGVLAVCDRLLNELHQTPDRDVP